MLTAKVCTGCTPVYARRKQQFFSLLTAIVLVSHLFGVHGHGFMTAPRTRGALRCPTRNIHPRDIAGDDAPIDYCPMCANAGSKNAVRTAEGGGPWRAYKPETGDRRGGFGMCGDVIGSYDHMKTGRFRNPITMPFVARYEPGSVANFEFDATANHGGFLEFRLCDVANMPNQDIGWNGFPENCYLLQRVPHPSCESGDDPECGPVDPRGPEKWVLPCGTAGGDTGDQLLGGSGKMAYRIPNVIIEQGVLQMYWLTTNDCTTSFMEKYDFPRSWGNCQGDGGSLGGKPQHHIYCGDHGMFPEEFWNCADVQVVPGGEGNLSTLHESGPIEFRVLRGNQHELRAYASLGEKNFSDDESSHCVLLGGHCYPSDRCCEPFQQCTFTGLVHHCIS